MTDAPENQKPDLFVVHEQPLDDVLDDYLRVLARHPPFMRQIEVDSERIVEDFEAQWPVDRGWERQAIELGALIAGLVLPMLDSVKARYGFLTIQTGAALKPPPAPEEGLALCAIFDAGGGLLRYRFTASHAAGEESASNAADDEKMAMPIAGMVLMCQPMDENFHRQRSIVSHWVHQHGNFFDWTQRAINILFELEAEKRVVGQVVQNRSTGEMQRLMEDFRRHILHLYAIKEIEAEKKETLQTVHGTVISDAIAVEAASKAALPFALPPGIEAVEQKLAAVSADPHFGPELRALAGTLAQELRSMEGFNAASQPATAGPENAAPTEANLHRPSPHVPQAADTQEHLPQPEPDI